MPNSLFKGRWKVYPRILQASFLSESMGAQPGQFPLEAGKYMGKHMGKKQRDRGKKACRSFGLFRRFPMLSPFFSRKSFQQRLECLGRWEISRHLRPSFWRNCQGRCDIPWTADSGFQRGGMGEERRTAFSVFGSCPRDALDRFPSVC